MVNTRASKSCDDSESSQIIKLKSENDKLHKENASLLKQLHLIGEEYDSVLKRLKCLEEKCNKNTSKKEKINHKSDEHYDNETLY